jgi:hypothetical protein
MRAELVPGSLNEEARTVDIIWTTGARVLRRSFWDGDFYEELSLDPKHVRMGRLESGRAPYLRAHNIWDPDAHVGVVVSARLEDRRGVATIRFLQGDAEADKEWNKVRQGVLTTFSVGYRVYKFEKTEGGDGATPVMRATDWEPVELSGAAIPADAGAHARSSPDLNPCEFVNATRGAEPHMKENKVPESNATSPASPQGQDALRAAAVEAERARVAEITALVRKAALPPETGDALIAGGKSVDEARAVIFDKIMERSASHGPIPTPSGAVEVARSERDKRLEGMTAWMLERSGYADLIARAQQDAKHGRRLKGTPLDGGEFRGTRLLDLARMCLESAGVKTRGMDAMTLVGHAFTHRAGGYQTTAEFGVLFENVMHKLVLGAYATTPDTWSRFCATTTVSDFRPSNRYRAGSLGELDSLNEHGEFKNKNLPDGEKFAVSTGTKGNIVALSRQAIINDDLGMLADMATKLGRAARLSIEMDVYRLLAANSGMGPTMADGNPFFHSSRGNVNSTGSALSVAGLDADRVVMAQQKDQSGNEILDLRPAVLLLSTGLGGEGRLLNDAAYDPGDNKFMKPNRVRGLFRDVVDTARLSGTRRYLFADPAIAPAFMVAFLEGQGQEPVVESENGWRIDGTEWKVRLDAKAQAFDPRGAVTNAGA